MTPRLTSTISEYISSHLSFCRKKIVENTPGISDEWLTANHILQGVVTHEPFSPRAIGFMLDSPLTAISDVQHRLEQYESLLNQNNVPNSRVTRQHMTSHSQHEFFSRGRSRGHECVRFVSSNDRGLCQCIMEINTRLEVLQATKPQSGRMGARNRSSANRAQSSLDEIPAKILQALQSLNDNISQSVTEHTPPRMYMTVCAAHS